MRNLYDTIHITPDDSQKLRRPFETVFLIYKIIFPEIAFGIIGTNEVRWKIFYDHNFATQVALVCGGVFGKNCFAYFGAA